MQPLPGSLGGRVRSGVSRPGAARKSCYGGRCFQPAPKEIVMAQGFALFAATAPDVIRAAARESEALGYTSFWVNHPGSTDGLAALAQAAAETRQVALGVGVVPLHTRGPESIAKGVRDTKLPLDRLLLGVGSPNPRSLDRVREGVAALRAQLATRIVVAALGPKMCHLAGEVADGVLLNWVTPEYAKRSADLVRAGAAAAGRPAPRIYVYVRLSLGPAGRARTAQEADRYDAIPAYHANFERMGVKPVETAIAVDAPAAVRPALDKWKGAVDEVVLRAVSANDTLDETLALVRAAKPV
jgi:alkanesulfonate monooxygenase SsuD/methylene tetrahydromethanopterin reductase-like flavin-dependent oxidoreductase (luciferase family)